MFSIKSLKAYLSLMLQCQDDDKCACHVISDRIMEFVCFMHDRSYSISAELQLYICRSGNGVKE